MLEIKSTAPDDQLDVIKHDELKMIPEVSILKLIMCFLYGNYRVLPRYEKNIK